MTALREMSLYQQGVALLVALLMLVAVLLIGASAARLAWQGEKAARAERDRLIAFQAAEDALADAEREIEGGADSWAARSALFAAGGAAGFDEGCGAGEVNQGLCSRAEGDAAPAWQAVDLAADSGAAMRSVPLGRYTGATMETGQGFLPFKRPRYIIERVPYHRPGEEAGSAPQYFYRVTAIGFGARASTEVVLQSSYRKAD